MIQNPLVKMLAAIVAVAAALFLFLVWVNPFGVWPSLFGTPFPIKAERIDTVRMVKAYDLVKSCPDDVISGMSTVVWGIDPKAYPRPGHTLYNGGIVGSSVEEQYYYLKRYVDLCPGIKRVYLDLNGEAMRVRYPTGDFATERLSGSDVFPPDILFTSFSTSGLLAAVRTVSDGLSGRVKQMLTDDGDGFHYRPNMGKPIDHYRAILHFLEGDTARRQVRISELQFGFLQQLVHEMKQRNVETVVFFGPISQVLFAQAEARELNPVRPGENMYFELRRRVAEVTPFWDCGLNNPVTGEDIANLTYFFDQIHYMPNLGTAALAAINGIKDPAMPDNLCVQVSKQNTDAHIAALRSGTAQWRQQYPAYAKLIEDHYRNAPELAETQNDEY